jgi:hypothetical protein
VSRHIVRRSIADEAIGPVDRDMILVAEGLIMTAIAGSDPSSVGLALMRKSIDARRAFFS